MNMGSIPNRPSKLFSAEGHRQMVTGEFIKVFPFSTVTYSVQQTGRISRRRDRQFFKLAK